MTPARYQLEDLQTATHVSNDKTQTAHRQHQTSASQFQNTTKKLSVNCIVNRQQTYTMFIHISTAVYHVSL